MKLLYGETTLAIYIEGKFYCLPLWLLENQFSSLNQQENIEQFKLMPNQERKLLMSIYISELDLTHTLVERNDYLQTALLDYHNSRIVEEKYLVWLKGESQYIVPIQLICEHFKKNKRKSIAAFFKLTHDNKMMIHNNFKKTSILNNGKSGWDILENRILNIK